MFLSEIDKSQIAVLSNIGTTETAVSLGAGGAAVLSVPSAPLIDSNLFKLVVSGRFHTSAGGTNFGLGLYLGSSITLASNTQLVAPGTSSSGATNTAFSWDVDFLWDSVSQSLYWALVALVGQVTSPSSSAVGSITSQASLQFILSGKFGTANAANSLTITEFKLMKTEA